MVGTRFPSWPSDTANPRRGRPEPKILYQWTVPAGCGYACRIIETEPGIVQMQQRPLDIEAEAWETVPAAMGAANELIELWAEVEDWRESAWEAHRALAWVCMDLPFDAADIPEHLRPPEFVTRQVKQAKAQYPTRISTLDEWWRCPECGPGVAGDEDGCCANCGADLEIERRSPEPTTAGTQRGTT